MSFKSSQETPTNFPTTKQRVYIVWSVCLSASLVFPWLWWTIEQHDLSQHRLLMCSTQYIPAHENLIHVNFANSETLLQLKGIGEVLAGRIVDYRQEHGFFNNANDLQAVSGIGPHKASQLEAQLNFAKISPYQSLQGNNNSTNNTPSTLE